MIGTSGTYHAIAGGGKMKGKKPKMTAKKGRVAAAMQAPHEVPDYALSAYGKRRKAKHRGKA